MAVEELRRSAKQERRFASILNRLRETDTASVEVVRGNSVSLCITIRRDLEDLHARGLLRPELPATDRSRNEVAGSVPIKRICLHMADKPATVRVAA
jgi:DeoR/GlpR family transcriptional regulator of sugar metabolism